MNREPTTSKPLGLLLCEQGAVTVTALEEALVEQRRSGRRLGETLISLEAVSEEQIARALAEQWGYPYLDLTQQPPSTDAVALVPAELAERFRIVPVRQEENELIVAMSDPFHYESIRDISFASGLPVRPVISAQSAILRTIEEVYRRKNPIAALVEESARHDEESGVPAAAGDPLQILSSAPLLHETAADVAAQSQAAPIVRLVDHLLRTALKWRASDLHLEPGPAGCRIRYRVDGLLREEQPLPARMQAAVISRIKVLARLDIAERRLPQDGSFRIRSDGRQIDLRVSVIPLPYGEKVVIRLLDQAGGVVGLEALGCSEPLLGQLRALLRRTRGIVLVTGPTGSGKTTTLYSMIQALNQPVRNIATVEDPIEYQMAGVNQVQVNPEIGLSFARALRALLRQDPNVILIGEIRDGETAEIAFRAAMTGHLVLSTLHTNDAPSTVTRLLDLGVPRYLVASQLTAVVAQRLVRAICPRCRDEIRPPEELMAALRLSPEALRLRHVYAGRGCPHCRGEGYWGRTAIFESLLLTMPLRELIASGASESALRAGALSAGMRTLGADGLEQVWRGVTTLDEVARVTAADEECARLCPSCLTTIEPDFLGCPRCGVELRPGCPSCRRPLQPDWAYCPHCRKSLESGGRGSSPP
jgi:type II secretory ATPase GspE/PulE/Tfp pilus assembly ATPase PilB-like protein